MAFREKHAWLSLLAMVVIYGAYFLSLSRAGAQAGGFHLGLLDAIIAFVVIQVVLTTALALYKPGEAVAPRDEREKLIDLRANRVAYAALATSLACACFFGAFDPPIRFGTNALLFILVAAEVLRAACQIVQYRRA